MDIQALYISAYVSISRQRQILIIMAAFDGHCDRQDVSKKSALMI